MTLSANEADILDKIVGFGGYATKEMIALYRKDITADRCYRILKSLESKNYIKQREYFQSHRQPDVFQVTKKACRLFGREEAYMRKKHKPFAIRRYLIRSHFLFLLVGKGINIKHYSPESRAEYLKNRGFTEYYLQKRNDAVQVDEFIIDDAKFSKGNNITLVYTDNPDDNAYRQIAILLEKYNLMLKHKSAFLDFLIVTEGAAKAELYMEAYHKRFFKPVSMFDIKTAEIKRNYRPQY